MKLIEEEKSLKSVEKSHFTDYWSTRVTLAGVYNKSGAGSLTVMPCAIPVRSILS